MSESWRSSIFQESNYSDSLWLEIFNSQRFSFTLQGQASKNWEARRSEEFPKGQGTPVTSESLIAQKLSSHFLRANCSKAQRDPPYNQFLQRLHSLARIAFSFNLFPLMSLTHLIPTNSLMNLCFPCGLSHIKNIAQFHSKSIVWFALTGAVPTLYREQNKRTKTKTQTKAVNWFDQQQTIP